MKNSNPNIELTYLYRDAGNYKLFEEIIFENPDNLSLKLIDKTIRTNLIDNEFFIPEKWGLKKPAFLTYISDLDHDWCEYLHVNSSNETPTSKLTILEFLVSLEKQRFL